MPPQTGNHSVTPYARVVVCEKCGEWALAIRRLLEAAECSVVETRSLDECWQELAQSPASFVALELLPGNTEAVLRRLLDMARQFRHARVVVLAQRGLESYQWVLREAGAVHVAFSYGSLPTVARLVDRHMRDVSEPPISFRQAVWRRLPWAKAAASL
jgi:hypothetical protein